MSAHECVYRMDSVLVDSIFGWSQINHFFLTNPLFPFFLKKKKWLKLRKASKVLKKTVFVPWFMQFCSQLSISDNNEDVSIWKRIETPFSLLATQQQLQVGQALTRTSPRLICTAIKTKSTVQLAFLVLYVWLADTLKTCLWRLYGYCGYPISSQSFLASSQSQLLI